MKEEVIKLLSAFGWEDMGPQKNTGMISFKKEGHEDERINYYFTTGTITFQRGFVKGYSMGNIKSIKKATMEQIEDLVTNEQFND